MQAGAPTAVSLLTLLGAITLSACDRGSSGGGAGAGGGGGSSSAAPPILQPFQGSWTFSLPKTVAQWKADGVPQTEIAQAQALAKTFPLHADMRFENDLAILLERNEGEYKFFALHPHNQWVCGKAWHHEDRHDPGDMDKYLVRLEIKNADLYLSVRIPDDAADPNDPDVTNTPLTADSAATCGADAAPTPPWSPWRTYVFERSSQ